MDKKLYDAVSVITAVVLLPMVVASAMSFFNGTLTFSEYSAMWREPLALLLGFWLRGVGRNDQGGT